MHNRLAGFAVFAQNPEADTHDVVVVHLVRRRDQFRQNGRAEIRVLLDNGADEDDNLHAPVARQKVHQGVDHTLSHVRKADSAPMNSRDEHVAVHLPLVLARIRALLGSLGHLPLECGHHLADILGCNERHGNVKDLLAYIRVGRAQSPQNVLQQFLQNLRVLLLQLPQPFQYDHHDVIVILGVEEVGVRHSSGADGRRGVGEGDERPSRLV
mmetsp:Transcript_46581/g.98854  ORF Transcript_46581/g.98854 Transcript_46581/m.98854 type:complete len:212 (+) Transcript_46581:1722-2357(+)